ncbi:MAG: MaoC family dehydratase [Bacilli bacterium]|nr:MaoC family dehydratase [Bacilli bacterium]MDD4123868.1 MaoC family dehydratase [Bacilli bacterium]MDD4584299.1 MaoC family dehydratase [Bacilli bacterium]
MYGMELLVGAKASLTKKITDADVRKFSEVSLDTNPLHLDEEFAKTTIFGRRIAHGMISAGLISAVLANKLPGQGSIYLSQELKFTAPVFLNDTITAEVEIVEEGTKKEKGIYRLKTTVTNQDGKVVTTGFAVAMNKG